MLATLVVGAFLLVAVLFAGAWHYLNILDRRIEARQVAHIKSLAPAEQQTMLGDTRRALCTARTNYGELNQLWLAYPLGRFRNNPYNIPRLAAAMECSRLNHLIGSLEKALVAA